MDLVNLVTESGKAFFFTSKTKDDMLAGEIFLCLAIPWLLSLILGQLVPRVEVGGPDSRRGRAFDILPVVCERIGLSSSNFGAL